MSFLTRSQLQSAAKAALEAHPLFTGARVPVITNYIPPGEKNSVREGHIRDKGACLEISPVLRQRLVTYKRSSLVACDCTISIAVRMSPTLAPGNTPLLPLTLDTAVDAVIQAMLGVGLDPRVPFAEFAPEEELAQLVEDAEGLLSTAVFFSARTHLVAA